MSYDATAAQEAPERTDIFAHAMTKREVQRALKEHNPEPADLHNAGLLTVDSRGRMYVLNGANQWVFAGQLRRKREVTSRRESTGETL